MWQPLREPVFRALWISAFFSNIGSLMQDVAAAWLMTSLTTQPLMVALLQTVFNVPFFILALLAGALADVTDRRLLLIIGQAWMGLVALVLGILTVMGLINAWSLLGLTFLMGFGAAITSPAWNALVPELVRREKLEQAIALNSVGYNTARGVGSALGGLIVAVWGSGTVFIINAASFLGVIGVLMGWKRPEEAVQRSTSREPLFSAMRAGMRFARYSPGLKAVFVKTVIWATSTSAMWALVPLIARQKLGLGSAQYGLLLGAFGVGTLIGAAFMPKLRASSSLEATTRFGFVLWAVAMALMSWEVNFWSALVYMAAFGAAWIMVNSSLNTGAQLSVPSWVRARALALYVLVFQGFVAIGSAIWGRLGDFTGLSTPLLCASLLLVIGLLTGKRYHLKVVENFDTTLSGHWVDPNIVYNPEPHHGPVLVTVEYVIDTTKHDEFIKAMAALAVQRKRDGAFQWHLFCDLSDPKRYVEEFLIESWGEHVRQHERVMNADIAVERHAGSFHVAEKQTRVRHFVSAYTMDMMTQIAEVQKDT